MFDLSQIFIGTAFAQAATDQLPSPPGGSGTSIYSMFVPTALIFAVFYFVLIRPQNKKYTEQEKMQKALQRGDRVITTGGIHGKITRIENDLDHLMVEIADGVNIKILRSHIVSLAAKTQPVVASAEADAADTKN